MGSVGDTMPMAVAVAFSATSKVRGTTTGLPTAGPMPSVAVPVAALPAGSRTAYVRAEVTPNTPGVGVNARLVSWPAVSAWPVATATPASVTAPSVGSAPRVTVSGPDG